MPKRIVLFADGTGNAFSTQESNVWRLYEALDKAHSDQIAYYIKGVGTSSVRVLSALDGATGLGVPSNVCELYRFLCRNWEPDDQIFMFGFSRGAFTIRTLIGLIDDQGLVPNILYGETVAHDEMTRNVNNAWRRFRATTAPWNETLPTIWVGRWLRDAVLGIVDVLRYRTRYGKFRYKTIQLLSRRNVRIAFAGVFDTVEAYGVPIEELRKAIDVAVWPISFNNRRLSSKVECARHALSLDDERITFHPLRFDRSQETDEDRIKEVWFAGVHSDVGGGYPDYELALVPCVWMAEEARAHGLRFKEDAIEEIRAESSALGPRHDSRAGMSVFYRYAPRPVETSAEAGGIPVIHHSVAQRMVGGSDNYAPLTLPHTARVLMPNGETLQIDGFKRADVAFDRGQASSELAHEMDVAIAAVERLKEPDSVLVERALSTVLCRRILYFLMLAAAAVVVAWPWIVEPIDDWREALFGILPFSSSLKGWYDWVDYGLAAGLDSVRGVFASLIPGYVKNWSDALVDNPVLTITLVLIVLGLWRSGGTLGDRINDRARIAWGLSTHAPRREVVNGFWVRVAGIGRTGPVRWIYRQMNSYVVPALVIIVLGGLLAVAAGRFLFTAAVGVGKICEAPKGMKAQAVAAIPVYASAAFDTGKLCWWSGFKVEKGHNYALGIEMQDRWFDRTIFASPYGFKKTDDWFWLFALARRWPDAYWYQPAIKIGSMDTYEQLLVPLDGPSADAFEPDPDKPDTDNTHVAIDAGRLGLFDPISSLGPDQTKRANEAWDKRQPRLRTRFVAEFTADNDGDLFLYVNDAVHIFWLGGGYGLFYRNNSGRAAVWLQQKPLPAAPPEPPRR
ncbi:MAG TPA: DUF2235 domain-containing protein [Xanthobacteraceae bacterium]|nr:DUF2235 domain-containing protein [Xanthobacteraceae bacterium]